MLKTIDVMQSVRSHADMYLPHLGDHASISDRLLTALVMDIRHLGASNVHCFFNKNLVFLCSDFHWLAAQGKYTMIDFFSMAVPMPNAPQNSIRHEVCISAFSTDILFLDKGVTLIRGRVDAFDVNWLNERLISCGGKFGLAFYLNV